ncbi:terminase [Clostridium botulinum]|nr:terminase [Clostridium botulinum]MCS4474860.1 terminase [Clostridium botulinum]MCS4480683.1 terminase [Clostridium botulinum]MCS4482755.1 terminase [Clostridium botulinum]
MIRIYKNYNGKTSEITNFCISVTLGGSLTEVSRKLECTCFYKIWDHNHVNEQIGPITKVWAVLENKEIFRGVVIDRSINSDETLTFTAFDYAFYLMKNKVTYNFKNITANNATKKILSEIGVQAGSIASSNIKINRLIAQKTVYDSIMELYTQVSKQTGKQYYIYMSGLKVNIGELGKNASSKPIKPTSDVFHGDGNMLSFEYKDTMNNMIDRVKIYDDKNGYIGKVEISENIRTHGILQDNYVKEEDKNPYIVAKNMLRGADKEFSCTTIGNYDYRTGSAVIVKLFAISSLLNTKMYVIEDNHTWDIETGTYTTDLNLSYVNKMDAKED